MNRWRGLVLSILAFALVAFPVCGAGLATAAEPDRPGDPRAAIADALTIADPDDRDRRLTEIAHALAAGRQFGPALEAALRIGDWDGRRLTAGSVLADQLRQEGLAEALRAGGALSDEDADVLDRTLAAIAEELARAGNVTAAIEMASEIRVDRGVTVEMDVHDFVEQRDVTLAEIMQIAAVANDIEGARAAAARIADKHFLGGAQVRVVGTLAEAESVDAALAFAREIATAAYRDEALLHVAQAMSRTGNGAGLNDAIGRIEGPVARVTAMARHASAEAARSLAESLGDARQRAAALAAVMDAHAAAGRRDQAVAIGPAARNAALAIGNREGRAVALFSVVTLQVQLGDFEGAAASARRIDPTVVVQDQDYFWKPQEDAFAIIREARAAATR